MIIFTPLSEPYRVEPKGKGKGKKAQKAEVEHVKALAYLVEVDDIRILIDCGAPESFQFNQSGGDLDDKLRELAPTIDLVLLCHSNMAHLGLYAYAKAKFGLTAPCYTTLPVATMGRLTVLESIQSIRAENDLDPSSNGKTDENEQSKNDNAEQNPHWCIATADEVNDAFEQIITLRYLQPTHLDGRCAGLTLTAYSAGHTLGGAVWKLRSPSSGTLLIALDWNHFRERHIDGTALVASSGMSVRSGDGTEDSSDAIADAIRRPDLLITSMARFNYKNTQRKKRDAALLDVIHNTIRAGNTVLIPVDAASRLLELLVLLDQHWAYAYPHVRFPLCLVSQTGREMLERARTLMEWMTGEWARKGQNAASAEAGVEEEESEARKKPKNNKTNNGAQAPSSPLDFKFLRIFSSLQAMDEALSPSDAKVVLAWPPSLTHGPARKLVARIASNDKDVIVLTGKGEPNSLTRQIFDEWENRQNGNARPGVGNVGEPVQGDCKLEIEIHDKVPLQGEELEAHNEAIRAANERAAQQRALLARSTRRIEADDNVSNGEGSSDEESDDEEEDMLEETTGEEVKSRGQGMEADDGHGGPEISFDIYLKGNASRATTFIESSGERTVGRYKTGIRFRTFPVIERKKRIDGYGETLDLRQWLHRRKQLEALGGEEIEAQSAEDRRVQFQKQQAQKAEEEEKKRKEREPPTKFVVERLNVHLQCKLLFVEMDGLGDSQALRTIIPQLEPRRVIFVESNSSEQRQALEDAMGKILRRTAKDIYMPIMGEKIEIGESTANFTVNLGEDIMGSVRFSSFQDYDVTLLRAKVNFRTESSIPMLEPVQSAKVKEEDEDEDAEANVEKRDDVIALDDERGNVKELQPTTLFIGDLKLSSLKQTLLRTQRPAIPSEFIGQGTLVCGASAFKANAIEDDVVTVRKENQGEIVIEGNASRNFYKIRDAVYGLHAQVTGQ